MPGPLTVHIARVLRSAVREAGLTQTQVGELLGQSQRQVSRYLGGTAVLDVEELAVLCTALGVDMSELVQGVQCPAPD